MSTIDEILKGLEFFTATDIAAVKQGSVVTKTLDSTNERELAAGFAMLMKVSHEELAEIFLESKGKQKADDNIRAIGIFDPEKPDFSGVQLEPNGAAVVKDYLAAKPGSDLNLSKEEIAMFQALGKKATQAQVEDTFRKVLTQRVQAYHQKGLEGIAPYARSRETYQPGKELLLKIEKGAPVLKKRCPQFWKYLAEYPNSKPEGVQEAYSWINFTIEDKPTICLVHKACLYVESEKCYLFYQRHFYVARGHNSVQGIGGAFATSKPGEVIMAYASRTSTDQVAGFGGAAKRGIGARVMCGRLADNFKNHRAVIEKESSDVKDW